MCECARVHLRTGTNPFVNCLHMDSSAQQIDSRACANAYGMPANAFGSCWQCARRRRTCLDGLHCFIDGCCIFEMHMRAFTPRHCGMQQSVPVAADVEAIHEATITAAPTPKATSRCATVKEGLRKTLAPADCTEGTGRSAKLGRSPVAMRRCLRSGDDQFCCTGSTRREGCHMPQKPEWLPMRTVCCSYYCSCYHCYCKQLQSSCTAMAGGIL